MAKKRPTLGEQARLRAMLLVPEFIEAHERDTPTQSQVTPVQELVDHVLADDHPGDDVFEPQWLVAFARDAFNHHKMRARLYGETPAPLAPLARECVDAYDDEIMSWGASAFGEFGWQHNSRGSPLGVEQLSVIICLVGLSEDLPVVSQWRKRRET